MSMFDDAPANSVKRTTERLSFGDCETVLAHTRGVYDFVLADPPYARAGAAHTSSSNAVGRHSALKASDQFWSLWFAEKWRVIAQACKETACAMVFCDYRTIGALEDAVLASGSGWHVSQCAVWDRGSIGLGSPMRARHELIAFARGPAFKWEGRKDIANVFQCDWPYRAQEHHPAEKPIELIANIVRLFSGGGAVLDPFCGSGSSGLACRRVGVSWHGIEVDAETAKSAASRLGMRMRPFQSTVVRRLDGDSAVYLMNRKARGFGESCIKFASVAEVEVFCSVSIGPWKRDEHGEYADAVLVDEVAA